MKTPAKAMLVVPTRTLAEAIAGEWGGVPDKMEINAAHLPLTRLAATDLDRVTPQRAQVVADTAKYAGSDLLCYRATTPPSLVGQEAPRIVSTLNLVAAGLGATIVPASLSRLPLEGVIYRPLKGRPAVKVPLNLACRRGERSAAVLGFIDLVRKLKS